MLKLYEYPNSVCCQKVNLALIEKQIEWESIYVNLGQNEHYSTNYLKLNPKAVVPTITHNDTTIIESTLICEYLDETFSGKTLSPSTPYLRTQMRGWTKLIDESIHDGIADISFSAMFRDRMRRMTENKRQERFNNIGDPKRHDRSKTTFEIGVKSQFVKYAVFAFESAFAKIEQDLDHGQEWLIGDLYTLADLGLTPYLARLEYLNLLDVWIDHRPNVNEWWKRIKTRESYAQAISAALTEDDINEMGAAGNNIKGQIKKIRDNLLGK